MPGLPLGDAVHVPVAHAHAMGGHADLLGREEPFHARLVHRGPERLRGEASGRVERVAAPRALRPVVDDAAGRLHGVHVARQPFAQMPDESSRPLRRAQRPPLDALRLRRVDRVPVAVVVDHTRHARRQRGPVVPPAGGLPVQPAGQRVVRPDGAELRAVRRLPARDGPGRRHLQDHLVHRGRPDLQIVVGALSGLPVELSAVRASRGLVAVAVRIHRHDFHPPCPALSGLYARRGRMGGTSETRRSER